MIEGWSGDEYYTLFGTTDYAMVTRDYGVDRFLPGYTLVGLLGWDDFLLIRDKSFFTCPTLPMLPEHVRRTSLVHLPTRLDFAPDLVGRVKWYNTPTVFGGDPTDDSNVLWVDFKHTKS